MNEFIRHPLETLLGADRAPALVKLIFGGGWVLFLLVASEELAALSRLERFGHSLLTVSSAIFLALAAKDFWDSYSRQKEEEFKALADEIRDVKILHSLGRELKETVGLAEFYSSQTYADGCSAKAVLRARLYKLEIGTPLIPPSGGGDAGEKPEDDYDLEWRRFLTALHPMAVLGAIEKAQDFANGLYPLSRDEG